MKQLTLKSPAKLNLYLEILNKRPDGFHNLRTIFERIGLCDEITLRARSDKRVRIICNHPLVPRGSSNLAWRAAKALKHALKIDKGIDIIIKKNIPPASGLGGGSSNAASVLWGLNRFWRLGLSEKQLLKYARKLGSDTAFFIHRTTFALGASRGEKIRPLKRLKHKFWHILVVPRKQISTKLAYQLWDKNKSLRLTTPRRNVKIILLALQQNSLKAFAQGLYNAFTLISERLCPDILEIKSKLKALEIEAVSISGKGPAVFGIVSTRKEAMRHKRQLKTKGWSVFAVSTF
ncbi:MAG: 4-(cytidine 5'-diphospho)-2-C-methyl-D-erythritol kinase [Candidatus Omnitrophica bacterium]|nr:4-(cytidine 5'-diphospho)-2-C-methyl-D-erythritol kinase [Candidatus Omnitrophota bacterium]